MNRNLEKFKSVSKTRKRVLHEKVIGIVLSNILIGFGAGLIDTGATKPNAIIVNISISSIFIAWFVFQIWCVW